MPAHELTEEHKVILLFHWPLDPSHSVFPVGHTLLFILCTRRCHSLLPCTLRLCLIMRVGIWVAILSITDMSKASDDDDDLIQLEAKQIFQLLVQQLKSQQLLR